MSRVAVRIEGATPLLLHKDTGLDLLHPLSKKARAIMDKGKKKTDADREEHAWLEFQQGMYYSDEYGGPCIPAINITKSIQAGARRSRKGKDAMVGVDVEGFDIPIIYDGPRDVRELFLNPAFRDTRRAVVQRQGINRTRPRFNQWAMEFTLSIDEEIINVADVHRAMESAGTYCGLCDYRPLFGRFRVTKWEEISE